MRGNRAQQWLESYLYSARGHRAVDQSVFAAGERAGFSARKLRRAGVSLGITVTADFWELPPARSEALDVRHILDGDGQPAATRTWIGLPSVATVKSDLTSPLPLRHDTMG